MGISYVIIQTDSKINFLCSSKAELCLQWRVFPKKLLDPQIRNVTQESGSDCSPMQKRHHNNMRLFLLTNSVLCFWGMGQIKLLGWFLLNCSCYQRAVLCAVCTTSLCLIPWPLGITFISAGQSVSLLFPFPSFYNLWLVKVISPNRQESSSMFETCSDFWYHMRAALWCTILAACLEGELTGFAGLLTSTLCILRLAFTYLVLYCINPLCSENRRSVLVKQEEKCLVMRVS